MLVTLAKIQSNTITIMYMFRPLKIKYFNLYILGLNDKGKWLKVKREKILNVFLKWFAGLGKVFVKFVVS